MARSGSLPITGNNELTFLYRAYCRSNCLQRAACRLATLAVVEELLQRLGRRIQELRKQRGWSQERFAEVCGVHRTYVGQIETARKPGISVMSVARAARALGIPLSELFS